MLISLCHIPSAERLVCVVICGKELKESLNNTSILNKDISKFIHTGFLYFFLLIVSKAISNFHYQNFHQIKEKRKIF